MEAVRLSPDERRAGYRRLAAAAGVLLGSAVVLTAVFVLLGGALRPATAAGFGVVGILLVFGGVVAFARTSSFRRSGGELRMIGDVERREAERLALGLLGAGIVFTVVSLVLS
jgi:hypothetical protein